MKKYRNCQSCGMPISKDPAMEFPGFIAGLFISGILKFEMWKNK